MFVAVDVGVDSLTEGIVQSELQNLGEFDLYVGNNTGDVSVDVLSFLLSEYHNPQVKAIVGRYEISTTVFAGSSGQIEKDISVIGINTTDDTPLGENALGSLKSTSGEVLDLSLLRGDPQVFVTEPLAKKMLISTGDRIEFGLPIKYANGTTSFAFSTFLVAGIVAFEGKATQSQGLTVWIDRTVMNEIIDPDGVLRDKFTTIWISLSLNHKKNPVSIEEGRSIEAEIQALLDPRYNANLETPIIVAEALRAEIEDAIRSNLQIFKTFLNIMAFMIILAGILLISNIQIMSVEDRQVQIGILRALGATKGEVVVLFFLESLVLGVIGSFIGYFLGIGTGKYLGIYITKIFEIGGTPVVVINSGTITLALTSGVILAVITGIYPSLKARSINIVEVLRGIKAYKDERLSKKSIYYGFLTLIISLFILYYRNKSYNDRLWENAGWNGIGEQLQNTLFLTFLFLGLGLILSQYISRTRALNIISIGYIGLSLFFFRKGIFWLTGTGDATNLFILNFLMLVAGTVVLIGVNLDYLGAGIRMLLGFSEKTRAIGLVVTNVMTEKKVRSLLTFSIFAIILSLNVFVASWSESLERGSIDEWRFYAGGIDIVVDLDIPVLPSTMNYSDLISNVDRSIDDVTGLRHTTRVLGLVPPEAQSQLSLLLMDTYEINESTLRRIDGSYKYDIIAIPTIESMKPDQPFDTLDKKRQLELSRSVWDLFFSGNNISETGEPDPNGLPPIIVDASFTVFQDQDTITLLTVFGPREFRVIGELVNFALGINTFFPSVMILPQYAELFEAFQEIPYYNFYFVSTTHELDDSRVSKIAQEIERVSNAVDSPLRSKGIIAGASAIPVWDFYLDLISGNVRFLDFLQVFVSIGFLIGVLGLIVISLRNVAERRREIGMLRAIGFSRTQVVIVAIFEIFTLGLIGLIIGIIDGLLVAESFSELTNFDFFVPWMRLLQYFSITFTSAFIAGLIPGIQVARIPPSEALRYRG